MKQTAKRDEGYLSRLPLYPQKFKQMKREVLQWE
jgi:hypothetical protein